METTGLDPATCRVVELAVVLVDELGTGEPRVVLHSRVNPGEPIPAEASKVHGITDADVVDAPTFGVLWPQIAAALGGAVLCAYNVAYDAAVLGAELRRIGVVTGTVRSVDGTQATVELADGPAWWGRWLDPFVLVRDLDKFERGKKLRDAAERRGIALDAHGSAGDALATAMLLPALVRETLSSRRSHGAPVHPTVARWISWQRERALAQERDLVQWRAQQGSRSPVDCPWHRFEGLPAPVATTQRARGTAQCKSCGAPILWAVTRSGARIPLDPPEIRASENGSGRPVVLVVDGASRGRLREDPDGDVVGRESHYASCPNAEQHRRQVQLLSAVPERCARFRERRVSLRSVELDLPPEVKARLPQIEDGSEVPECGWAVLDAALTEALERKLMEMEKIIRHSGIHVVHLPPWTLDELAEAWKTAEARLGMEKT